MVQQTQQEVQRFVGVASTVAGLICYALSSSFNNLFGKWSLFKIFAYIVSSSIICLAVLFPKAWRHLRILHPYRAHFAFLVLISTTVYSYLDRKSKTKPDAYGLISSAAFATTSLCMSMQIECGFLDLMYFFCGLFVIQLMEIKPLLVFVGIGFGCFLVILRSYLDAPPNRSQSQPPQVVIDMPSVLQSSALDARPQEEGGGGSNENQAAIGPVHRRKTLPRWTEQVRVNPGMGVQGALDDGYSWRKYGQKDILGAKYPRGYYRCTNRYVKGCLATKQVQRSDEDPSVFVITYTGRHTCTVASSSKAVPATSTKENQDSNLNTNPQQQNVPQSLEQQPINELRLNLREGLRVQTENLDAPDQPPFVGSLYFPSTSNIKAENQVFTPPHPVLPENFTPPPSPLTPQE